MYLPEKDGTALFRRITEQFPSGQVTFDANSVAMVRLVSRFATVRGAKVELVWESMLRTTSRSRFRGFTSSRTSRSGRCPSWSAGCPRAGSPGRCTESWAGFRSIGT
jgi:O-methyltransferase involved in polyketide biosynthesis